MAEKVTTMVLKVDLQCSCCYKKVKKILCKFPQIRDQTYDEKGNTATIRVMCCDPEKIRDKLCCKGYKVIKSIEIKDPPKPKETEKKPPEPEKPKIAVVEKPKEPEKEKPKIVVDEKPKEPKVVVAVVPEKPKPSGPPPPENPKEVPKVVPPKIPVPIPFPHPPVEPNPFMVQGHPQLYPVPTCCGQCYGGYDGGPCFNGNGAPPPPRPFYDGYNGYWCSGYDNRDCRQFSRCERYFTDENPSACSIM